MTHDERTALWDASNMALEAIRSAITTVQKGPAKADGWTEMNLALGNSVISLLNDWQGHLQNTPLDTDPPLSGPVPDAHPAKPTPANPNGERSV